MNHETPLQTLLLKSLLGALVGVAWAWRDWLTVWPDDWRARVLEQARPLPRLDTGRIKRTPPIVVAALVAQSEMEDQVRRALDKRANLRFASTWAELQQIVARVSPSAIIADPVADERGDPARHLARFSHDWGIPVVLYTHLTPRSAGMLLQLGQAGIRHVIFRRLDDAPRRFVDAIDWGRNGPPLRAA